MSLFLEIECLRYYGFSGDHILKETGLAYRGGESALLKILVLGAKGQTCSNYTLNKILLRMKGIHHSWKNKHHE